MTRIVFKRDFDGYEAGKEYGVERTLASRIMERGIAISYTDHLAMLQKEADAEAKAIKIAAEKAAAKKAAAEKAAKEKAEAEASEDGPDREKKVSKKAKRRTRAVRK